MSTLAKSLAQIKITLARPSRIYVAARSRHRLGGRRDDEDLDQRVLVAFLGALRSVRVGPYIALAIRWATEGEVFASRRAERRTPRMAPFDDDTHVGDPFGADAHARAAAAEVVRIVEAQGDGELLEALLATRARDESLTTYVAREYAGRTEAERAAAYYRLRTARTRVVAEIRARLAPRAASPAARGLARAPSHSSRFALLRSTRPTHHPKDTPK